MDNLTAQPVLPRRVRRSSSRERQEEKKGISGYFLWSARVTLLAMLLIAPWWIGSVSARAQSCLLGLGAIATVLCLLTVATARDKKQRFPYIAVPVILGLLFVAFQTMPLGTGLSSVLAPHQADMYDRYARPVDGEIFSDSAVADGSLSVPQPTVRTTMNLDGTRESFYLLTLGLIGLLLGAYLFTNRRDVWLIPLAGTILGTAISLFGVIQKLKFDGRIYWFVELTYGGIPFGPFVNRNNAAGFLLVCFGCSLALLYLVFNRNTSGARPKPIITREYPLYKRVWLHFLLFIAELNAKKLAALLAITTIFLGILATMSRGGVLALLGGIFVTFWLVGMYRRKVGIFGVLAVSGILVCALMIFSGFDNQLTQRFDTLSDVELLSNEKRVQHWLQTMPAIVDYRPLGSGVGSYVNVHRVYRADRENKAFYHAENQYFQTLVEAGWLGAMLLVTALVLMAICVRLLLAGGNSSKSVALGMMGVFVLSSQMIAACLDFALFIPANHLMFAVVCGFLAGQSHSLAERIKKKSILRFGLSRWITCALIAVVLLVGIYSTLALWSIARTDEAAGKLPPTHYREYDLQATEQKIKTLSRAIDLSPTAMAHKRLAEFWIHRYRLQLLERLQNALHPSQLTDDAEMDRLWSRTSLEHLQRMIHAAYLRGDHDQVRAFQNDTVVQSNLMPAIWHLQWSRHRSPLQPAVHIVLGELHCLAPDLESEQYHISRAKELSPKNMQIFFISGVLEMHAKNDDDAVKSFRHCLDLNPGDGNLSRIVSTARTRYSNRLIANEIIPQGNALLLFRFAKQYLSDGTSDTLRRELLERVDELLTKSESTDKKSLLMRVEVQLMLGNRRAAIAPLQQLVRNNPSNPNYRYRLANLLIAEDQLDLAFEQAKWLIRNNDSSRRSNALLKRIERKKNQQNAEPF